MAEKSMDWLKSDESWLWVGVRAGHTLSKKARTSTVTFKPSVHGNGPLFHCFTKYGSDAP